MMEITKSVKEEKETIEEQESYKKYCESELITATFEIKDENINKEEEKNKVDHSIEEAKQKKKSGLTNGDLEAKAKYFSPGYSKDVHHRSHFTFTWVQYSDGLGYAYGGVDPLNYDPTTKNRFIRRVFVIVLVMLMITAAYNFCAAKMDLKTFYQEDSIPFTVLPTAVVMVALNIFMALSDCTRSPPATYICLLLTLIGTCVISGCISGRYDTLLMTYIYITTSFVAIGLIIIANTSYNFMHWTLHIIAVGIALPFVSGFCVIAKYRTIEHVRPAYPIYLLVIFLFGTLFYVLCMTITLRIVLGSEAVDILEDDYTLGAFYLYTSIFDIYIKLVQIIVYKIFGEEE